MTKLVYGGTPTLNNRTRESSLELEPVPEDIEHSVEKGIGEVNTFKELIEMFDYMVENNINMVGSRDYVYRSDCIKEVIKQVMLASHPNIILQNPTLLLQFTRSMGLRDKVIELLTGED